MAALTALFRDFLSTPARRAGLILFTGLLCLAPGFFTIPVTDRDEARFAQASKQMLLSGDFVDIRFQDTPRHKKPAGIYWLQAGSAAIFGGGDRAPIQAFRLPSLLGVLGAALLTLWALTPLLGAGGSSLAALILASSLLPGVEAGTAKTDGMLLAVVAAAMGAQFRLILASAATPGTRSAPSVFWIFWLALAFGILLKGPVILIPVLGLALLIWICRRRDTQRPLAWLRAARPAWGLPLLLLIALPWYILITLKTGQGFWEESLGKDMLGKVASGQEAHGAPPGYYALVFWVLFWPWAFLAIPGFIRLWRERRTLQAQLLAGWILPLWILFELIATKLPHYILPAFPALAAIAVLGWREIAARGHNIVASARLATLISALGRIVFVLPALVLILATWLSLFPLHPGITSLAELVAGQPELDFSQLARLLLAALALGLLIAFLWKDWTKAPARAAALAFGCAATLYICIYQFVLPNIRAVWISDNMARLEADIRPACLWDTRLLSGYHEPSAVFQLHGKTVLTGEEQSLAVLGAGEPLRALIWNARRYSARSSPDPFEVHGAALYKFYGFNYNRGHWIEMRLFASDRTLAHCIRQEIQR